MKRTFIWILVGLAVFVALALGSVGIWVQYLGPGWVENYVNQKTGADLKIGRIHTNFLNSLRFSNLKITRPIEFSTPEITLTVRPWAFIQTEIGYPKIIQITVNDFQLKVSPQKTANVPQAPTLPLWGMEMELKNGKVILSNDTAQLDLFQVQGTLASNPRTLKLNLSSRVNKKTKKPVTLEGEYQRGILGGWSSEFEVKNIPIEMVTSYVSTNTYLARLRGAANVSGKVKSEKEKIDFKSMTWEAQIQSRNSYWDASPYGTIPLSLNLQASPEKIKLKNFAMDRSVKMTGEILDPLEKKILNLELTANEWNLDNLAKIQGMNPEKFLQGNFSTNVRISGLARHPAAQGSFQLNSHYGQFEIPAAAGTVDLNGSIFELKGKMGEGNLNFKGQWQHPEKRTFQLNFQNASLKNWGEINGWKNVSGNFSTKLKGIWAKEGPRLQGSFGLSHFRWGRAEKSEEISGAISLSPSALAITTQDQTLSANASLHDNNLNINDFNVIFDNDSSFSLSGSGGLGDQPLKYTIQGRNLPPDIWPPLVTQYPDISGKLDFSGTIGGQKAQPYGQLNVVLKNLQFTRDGGKWNGSTDLSFDQEGLRLKKLAMDGGYSGELFLKKGTQQLSGSAKVQFLDATPQLALDFFKSPKTATGTINGWIDLSFSNGELMGQSSTTWTNFQFESFAVDEANALLTWEPQLITIQEMNLLKGSGALRGDGQIRGDLSKVSYDLNIQLNRWGVAPIKTDGETHLKGTLYPKTRNFNGTATSPIFWVNNFPLEGSAFQYKNSSHKFSISGGAPNKIQMDLNLYHPQGQIKGTVKGTSVQVGPIFKDLFGIEDEKFIAKGNAGIEAKIWGTQQNPLINLHLSIPETQWRNETFQTEVFFQLDSSTFTLSAGRVTFPNGGTLFASGIIPVNPDESMHIEGAANNIQTQTAFNLLRWPVRLEGIANGSLLMTGPKPSRVLEIKFEGEHQGFGPFQEEGEFQGHARLSDRKWDLEGIRVDSGNGFINLTKGSQIFLGKDFSGTMRLVADIRNLKMGVLNLFGRVDVVGGWETTNSSDGGEVAAKELDIFAKPLWINQFEVEGNITHLTIGKNIVKFSPIPGSLQQISGSIEFPNYPTMKANEFRLMDQGEELVFLNGLIGPNKWDFDARLKGIQANIVRGLFDTRIPITGPMNIILTGEGTPQNPTIYADVEWQNGQLGVLPVGKAKANVLLRDGIVEITNLTAEQKKGYLLVGDIRMGTSLLPEDNDISPTFDLTLTKGDGQLLESIWPACRSADGKFEGQLRLKNNQDHSELTGFFNAQNIDFRSSEYVPSLKDGNIFVEISNDRLKILGAQAKIGKGHVELEGVVDFKEAHPTEYDIYLKTDQKRGASINIPDLAIPPGPVLGSFQILKKKLSGISRGDLIATLELKGRATNPTLSGTVEIQNAVFTFPPQQEKAGATHGSVATRALKNFVQKINWDVALNAGYRTQYENDLVNAMIDGNLKFKGPTPDLSIDGKITSEKGSLIYAGNEFKINEAVLEVVTVDPILPTEKKETLIYLKVQTEREVFYTDFSGNSISDTIIMEVDRAHLGEIEPRFRSKNNPNLSSQKAFYLAMGFPLHEAVEGNPFLNETGNAPTTAQENDELLRAGLVQLLDSSLASPLARAIVRRTGLVDTLRLTYEGDTTDAGVPRVEPEANDPNVGTPGQNQWWNRLKGTKVRMGRELTNRLFADYSVKVDEYEEQVDFRHEIELAYRLHRNFFIRATSELDSQRTLGREPDRRAILENRWRFGLPRPKKAAQSPENEEISTQ